ncbi:MAG: FG-GAP repeat domain-containing protein, partial [Candidatus Hodarchaeota archaeon]
MKKKIVGIFVMTLLISTATLPVVANMSVKKMNGMMSADNVYGENLNIAQLDKMITHSGNYPLSWTRSEMVSAGTTGKTWSPSLAANSDEAIHVSWDRDDRSSMPSWPQYYKNIGPVAAEDIDNDGKLEIITFVRHQEFLNVGIGVWEHDGSMKSGFPVHLAGIGGSGGVPPVAIGDVDYDGELEIVTGYGWNSNKIYVINHDGSIQMGWPQDNGGDPAPVSGFAVLTDLDGNGYLEILAGGQRLNVWKYDGTNVIGFPKLIQCTSPAVGDLNNDGVLEIVTLTMTNLFVYNPTGVELLNVPLPAASYPNPPVLVDINDDGKLEILFSLQNGQVCAYTLSGVLIKTWTFLSTETAKSPVIGDVERDGDLEIFLCTYDFPNYGKIYGWDHNGNILPGWPINFPQMFRLDTTPILGDIDGDPNDSEIIVGGEEDPGDEHLYAFNIDGTMVSGWPKNLDPVFGYGIMGSAVVEDIDIDGDTEVIVSTNSYHIVDPSSIYVWDLSYGYNPYIIEWGMFQHDTWHTGVYTYPPIGPVRPVGKLIGKVGVSNKYLTVSMDLDNDKLYYWFDWGDNTNSGWIGPYNSGQWVEASHAWSSQGTYQIKVKAKDTHGAESDWSP